MTDLEAFLALYERFGIECQLDTDEDTGNTEIFLSNAEVWCCKTTTSDKFDGYPGFLSKVTFEPSGKFVKQGFWE